MVENMNWWAFLAIGLVPSMTSIVVALIQYNKGKSNLELEMGHLKGNFKTLKKDLREDITCVEEKIDENIRETGRIRIDMVSLEKDVEMLKEKG